MGSGQSSVIVNVYIDRRKEKVMFAEVEEKFVDILFSFMTLPLGQIANLCNYSRYNKVGSLTSLYQSVEKLDSNLLGFIQKHSLLYPRNSSASICRKLKVNLDNYYGKCNGKGNPVFLKNKGSFLVTDDLKISPFSLDQRILLLNSLGVEHIDLLEKRSMRFGYLEFSKLLKWSLVTSDPMTNVVIEERELEPELNSCITSSAHLIFVYPAKPQTIKLLVQKSKKRVICAIVNNPFVELLFSFLTIPLGGVKCLKMDTLSPMAINNVYNSISCLRNEHLKSEDVKFKLLDPKLSHVYLRVTGLLPIYKEGVNRSSFLQKYASFIISDNLKIEVARYFDCDITKATFGIPADDIEVNNVSIGEQEALFILASSLTSTTVLTDFLHKFMKPKA